MSSGVGNAKLSRLPGRLDDRIEALMDEVVATQDYQSLQPNIYFYIFDLLMLSGRNVMAEPLTARRALLEKRILPKLQDPIRYSSALNARLPVLIASIKAQGLEGLVAKRLSSVYEPGL